MAGNAKQKITRNVTTPIGTFSFPRIFTSTAQKKDDGTLSYDIQIIIPKTEREGLRAIAKCIREVGEGTWGDKWRKVKNPLRDGDAEADDLTEDGSTKGEKYPERLGCYFINARSSRPVAVVDRQRVPIENPDKVYGGSKGKIALSLYPYSTSGNHGIAAGLEGVQFIADGEPFGNARQAVESMFDLVEGGDEDESLEDQTSDLDDLADEPEPEPERKPAAKKTAAKKTATATARRKPAPAPEPEPEDDDLADLASDGDEADSDADGLYDDL